jgi:uncharacterized radical SAM superfamily Fe-S cluster-containing enzyme
VTTATGAGATPGGTRIATTESICPRCRRVLAAALVVRDGTVVLTRTCPDHGAFDAVVYGDAERYVEIQRFDKPGDEPQSTHSTPASGSSRSTPRATSTARSASPTRAPGRRSTATR